MRKYLAILLTLLSINNMNAQKTYDGLDKHSEQPYLTLNNGVRMPQLGLGLYMIAEGDEAYNSVMAAFKAGYRHFDCAHAYRNERSLGRALRDSGVPRDSVWIPANCGPTNTAKARPSKP